MKTVRRLVASLLFGLKRYQDPSSRARVEPSLI
jgi:hypothetical protein